MKIHTQYNLEKILTKGSEVCYEIPRPVDFENTESQ